MHTRTFALVCGVSYDVRSPYVCKPIGTVLVIFTGPRDCETELRETRCELLDWLIGHAVALEYADNAVSYGESAASAAAAATADGSSAGMKCTNLTLCSCQERATRCTIRTHHTFFFIASSRHRSLSPAAVKITRIHDRVVVHVYRLHVCSSIRESNFSWRTV